MTQAYNLAILANAVNTSGQLNVGTNSTGTLPVANGGTGASTLTANNVILGNGTGAVQTVAPSTNGNFLRSNGTTWVSQTVAIATGTVTSVATGNGLQGGTITTSGTLSVACPTWNTVGSYALCTFNTTGGVIAGGTNFSAGTGNNQMSGTSFYRTNTTGSLDTYNIETPGGLSGTWKNMSVGNAGINSAFLTLACRVS